MGRGFSQGKDFRGKLYPFARSPLFRVGDEMTGFDKRLDWAWWALKIGLGVGPIITGLDKYFNKLADWGMYLSPLVTKVVPVSPTTFMHVVGVVEIVAGLIVLSRGT